MASETLKPAQTFVLVAGDFICTGGMDRANYALASYLARKGNHVELVSHRVAANLASEPNVTVHLVSKPLNSYFLGHWALSRRGTQLGRTIAPRGGRVVINGGNGPFPDINWVHYLHAAYRPNNASSLLRRIKGMVEYPYNIRAERTALRSARVIICNSERTRRDVIEHCGVDAARTRVVYYGIDSQHFFPVAPAVRTVLKRRLGFSASGLTILFIGALGDRRKGFDTLFDAWRRLCMTTDWDVELLVVGSGAEMPAWIRRVNESSLQRHIRFLGFRTDVAELLQAADALVSPTRYEAYGLGVHEALSCGVPAIVSRSAGVAERYPQELHDLLLPNPEDSRELAEQLLHWRQNVDKWRERIQSFSELLRTHSWDEMGKQFLNATESENP